MNFNTDGFNERSNYIHNSNDMNRLKKMGPSKCDSSFAQMKINENKPDIQTVSNDSVEVLNDPKGNHDNFLLRSNSMKNANIKPTGSNPVSNALNKNMFKR